MTLPGRRQRIEGSNPVTPDPSVAFDKRFRSLEEMLEQSPEATDYFDRLVALGVEYDAAPNWRQVARDLATFGITITATPIQRAFTERVADARR